jgi:hypothetical protein
MRLSTMVNLVLNEMHQQAITPFNLDTRASIDPRLAAQVIRRQRVANTDEAPVYRRLSRRKLGNSWKRDRSLPGLRPEPSAFKRIDVKKINDMNVVQRSLQTREEARALGLEFALGQFGSRAQQAAVRPRIVVGEGAIGLNKPNTHGIS